MQTTLIELKKKLEFRHPTEEELALINQFRPRGAEPYVMQELYTVPILASTNLLHESLAVWTETALETMVATYPGSDLMLDHAWDEGMKTVGFVYDAELWHIPRPSRDSVERIIADSANPEIDRGIVARDGLYQVICYAAIEASHPIVSDIRMGRKSDVSIGGAFHGNFVCPLCNVPFEDRDNCSHYPPIGFFLFIAEPEELAPYYIRNGQVVSVELSMVYEGNCIQAQILSETLQNIVFI